MFDRHGDSVGFLPSGSAGERFRSKKKESLKCKRSHQPPGIQPATTGFFTDAHWWLFCFLVLLLNFLFLAFDPLPKLFLGDSGSYLWTALSGGRPPDRSFLYGYVIGWLSLWTESLTSLLILQAFLGAITAILVMIICRSIFGLTSRLSYLFGLLCSLDPLQLVWQRYVMTETVSLFFYALMLLFSFLYLKQRRLWQLAIVQILSVFVISFRMSYLLVVQMSAFFLPLIAFFPEIRAAFRKHSSALLKTSGLKSAGCTWHSAFCSCSCCIRAIDNSTVGSRVGNLPIYIPAALAILTTWAPVLKPTDSPDPRLSHLIAEGDQFRAGQHIVQETVNSICLDASSPDGGRSSRMTLSRTR